MSYSNPFFQNQRRKSREIKVGNVGVGKDNPIRIQSMTTTDTKDVDKTVDQIIRLVDAGCEIVRMTVQGKKEAISCEAIKNSLIRKGIEVPLVADIHFYPPAALLVADFVEKVRINPGNFADRRASFKTVDVTENMHQLEMEKIEEKFAPLVLKCKQQKKAMRIGTNHGSLSDRIMNQYGDTPLGMVKSAIEYAEICRKYEFHNFLFSMKSSNPLLMIQAYRLLVHEMDQKGWDYPLHLGVTEAGEGEDGRIKSSIGIGSLLLDGIGDTIRISLTEDPEQEIDPCQKLIHFSNQALQEPYVSYRENFRNFKEIAKQEEVFLHRNGTVVLKIFLEDMAKPDFFETVGVGTKEAQVDAIYIDGPIQGEKIVSIAKEVLSKGIRIISTDDFDLSISSLEENRSTNGVLIQSIDETSWNKLKQSSYEFIFFDPPHTKVHATRKFHEWLCQNKIKIPLVLAFSYDLQFQDLIMITSAEMGSLLCDGIGSGICIQSQQLLRSYSFNLLQACRMRSVKTEFISCPSCGRTLFDLQEVSAQIRSLTGHLPGIKIAIMGCIVNGPGEMADADFGYVGSKPGMVDLYVKKECIERNISFSDAPQRLIELIKKHNLWVEPKKELFLVR